MPYFLYPQLGKGFFMKQIINKINGHKVVSIDINKMKSNPLVTNMDSSTLAYLYTSIEQMGVVNPIIVNSKFEILSGHRRFHVSQELQNKTIPCIIIDNLTDEEQLQIEIDSHNSQRKQSFISQMAVAYAEYKMYDKNEHKMCYTNFNAEKYSEGVRNAQIRLENAKSFYLLKDEWQKILIQIDNKRKITKGNIQDILLLDDETLEVFFKLLLEKDIENSIITNDDIKSILSEAQAIIRRKNVNKEIDDVAKTTDEKVKEDDLKKIISNHKEKPELSSESIKMVLQHQINKFFNIEDENESYSVLEDEYNLDFSEEIQMIASLLNR